MDDVVVAVYHKMDQLKKAPKMWAATKEAFVAQVALLLDLVGKTSEAQKLYVREFAVPGTALMQGMADPCTHDWAVKIATEARQLLPRYPDRW